MVWFGLDWIAMALWIERVLLHFYVNNKNEKSTTRKHIETYAKWNRFSSVCSFVCAYGEKKKLDANASNTREWIDVSVSLFRFFLLSFSSWFRSKWNEEEKLHHWLLTTAMEQFNEFYIDWANIKVMILCLNSTNGKNKMWNQGSRNNPKLVLNRSLFMCYLLRTRADFDGMGSE